MSRPKNYVVRLTDEERTSLNTLLRKGHAKARTLTCARILILSEALVHKSGAVEQSGIL